MSTRSLLPLLALLLCWLAGPALAVDGVRELNQACAKNTGCLSGDAAGFPVTINAAGSYRLTSNLHSGNSGGTVVEVTAAGVTVDLNGFEIAPCKPLELCLNTGSEGYGVKASERTEIRVLNGTIRNMKLQAVIAGDRAHVESIHAVLNGSVGQSGIRVGASSRVVGNVVSGSGAYGISTDRASTVSDNRVQGNGSWGIFASLGSVVTGNTAYDNVSGGIWAAGGSTVRGNSVYSNNDAGIKAAGACTVRDNTVTDNGGVGLDLGADSGYSENVLANNDSNITGGGPLGINLCDGVSCNSPPRKRFYITIASERFNGATADGPNVCADGFHFASLWEIWDPSQLEYETSLGYTADDSGSGPPSLGYGWVRTGFLAWAGEDLGAANCNAWTSAAPSDYGTSMKLDHDWADTDPLPTSNFPWSGSTVPCSSTIHVWCVQD